MAIPNDLSVFNSTSYLTTEIYLNASLAPSDPPLCRLDSCTHDHSHPRHLQRYLRAGNHSQCPGSVCVGPCQCLEENCG
ncbi:type-2 angiotensin II receptor-like [Lates japonicus]